MNSRDYRDDCAVLARSLDALDSKHLAHVSGQEGASFVPHPDVLRRYIQSGTIFDPLYSTESRHSSCELLIWRPRRDLNPRLRRGRATP